MLWIIICEAEQDYDGAYDIQGNYNEYNPNRFLDNYKLHDLGGNEVMI